MQEQFVGLNRLFDLDISLLVLEERVPINNLIMPACIDWRGHMSPKHDDYGVVSIEVNKNSLSFFPKVKSIQLLLCLRILQFSLPTRLLFDRNWNQTVTLSS